MYDAYDDAVENAMERGDNVEEYLNWKTGKDAFQALLEKYWERLQVRKICENCGADPCICHDHACQQCDKILVYACVCANPNRMDWCSSTCRAAFDL